MKRHRPQSLRTLAAERGLSRLMCAVFLSAFLSSTLLAVLPTGVVSAMTFPGLLAEGEDSSQMKAAPDSAQTKSPQKSTVPSAEAVENFDDAEEPPSKTDRAAQTEQASTSEKLSAPENQPDRGQKPAEEKAPTAARGLTPFSTFAAIEKAWNAGCPDSIVILFPKENITLNIETNVPEEASFSRQQAAYILKDALCYTVTESFEFLEFEYDKDGGAPPYADAEWSYRRELEGEVVTEKVHVTLRNEEGRWLIAEIRILD